MFAPQDFETWLNALGQFASWRSVESIWQMCQAFLCSKVGVSSTNFKWNRGVTAILGCLLNLMLACKLVPLKTKTCKVESSRVYLMFSLRLCNRACVCVCVWKYVYRCLCFCACVCVCVSGSMSTGVCVFVLVCVCAPVSCMMLCEPGLDRE